MNSLTSKELNVASLVAEGLKNKEIAPRLAITENSTKRYLKVIFDKLGVWNRTELALWYVARNK